MTTQRSEFRFLERLRVRWVEVDAQKIVFNGHYLMYFVTVAAPYTPDMVVGVAQSDGDFTTWGNSFALWNTRHHWRSDRLTVVESPHVFYRYGNWWLFSTVNGDSVWGEANAVSPRTATAVVPTPSS